MRYKVYSQGLFKEGDMLVVIDPVMDNDWDILILKEDYGRHKEVETTLIYEDGEKCNVENYFFNTIWSDTFCDIYLIKEVF